MKKNTILCTNIHVKINLLKVQVIHKTIFNLWTWCNGKGQCCGKDNYMLYFSFPRYFDGWNLKSVSVKEYFFSIIYISVAAFWEVALLHKLKYDFILKSDQV